jgi:hypothetical protein
MKKLFIIFIFLVGCAMFETETRKTNIICGVGIDEFSIKVQEIALQNKFSLGDVDETKTIVEFWKYRTYDLGNVKFDVSVRLRGTGVIEVVIEGYVENLEAARYIYFDETNMPTEYQPDLMPMMKDLRRICAEQ